MGSQEVPEAVATYNSEPICWDRLFDDKVALSSAYDYHGKNGERWCRLTRRYILTRLPAVGPVR